MIPGDLACRLHLAKTVGLGERGLQSWLMQQPWQAVPLNPEVIRNCNRPEEIASDPKALDPAPPFKDAAHAPTPERA